MTTAVPNGILCSVCRRDGSSLHYGATVCDPCRSFFRRAVRRIPKWTCPFQNNCEIMDVCRMCCKKCRYEKCLAVGMQKESVQLPRDSIVHPKRRFNSCGGGGGYGAQEHVTSKQLAIGYCKTEEEDQGSSEFNYNNSNNNQTIALFAVPEKQPLVYLEEESMRFVAIAQKALEFQKTINEAFQTARCRHDARFAPQCSTQLKDGLPVFKVVSSKDINSMFKEEGTALVEVLKTHDVFVTFSTDNQLFLVRSFAPCAVVLHDVRRSICFDDHLLLLDHRSIIPRPKTHNVDVIFDALLPAFKRFEPDEIEFALLLCIALWNSDVCCNEDKQIVRDLRFRYLETLEWYVFQKLLSSCGRHGSLVMITTMLERFRRCLALGMRYVPDQDPLVKEIFSIVDLER